MMSIRPIFRILRGESDPAVEGALLTALERCDAPTAQAIVATLLERKQRPGLYGLVARLHLLDESLRRSLAGEIDKLFSVLREAVQSRTEQTHLNALEMIRRGRAYRASYLLENSFRDASTRVREAAGETLCFLAEEILSTCPAPPDSEAMASMTPEDVHVHMAALETYAEDRRQFAGAVEAGLNLYDIHRQNRVIEVAMWFVDDLDAKFWSVITSPNSRMAHAALRVLGDGLTPRLVPFAMASLNYGQFRAHVAPLLGQCTAPDVLAEWVRQSWRLVQPKAARAMTALKELACLERRAVDLARLSEDSQRHLGKWLLATGLPSECKTDAMLEILHRGERTGRRSALWAVTEWIDEMVVPFLRNVTSDGDPDLARTAKYEICRRRLGEYAPSELLAAACGPAPVSPVRSPTAQPLTFERYWSGFDRLSDTARARVGLEVVATTPNWETLLGAKLADADPAIRLRAVGVVRSLGKAEPFADQLHRMAHDSDVQIRSAVMAVLAQVPGGTSKRILRSALCDEDTRVRANAIEAVEQANDEDIVDILLPMLGAPDNRVRANAVKALLKQGVRPAAETLLQMLEDPDRAQRISALWLVDHMGLLAMAAKTSRMAACDPDPQVRLRAQKVIDRLRRSLPTAGQPVVATPIAAGEVSVK